MKVVGEKIEAAEVAEAEESGSKPPVNHDSHGEQQIVEKGEEEAVSMTR